MCAELLQRRKEPRYPFSRPVRFSFESDPHGINHAGEVVNISNSGLSLTTQRNLAVGEQIIIQDDLPNSCRRATVRWIGEDQQPGTYLAGLLCTQVAETARSAEDLSKKLLLLHKLGRVISSHDDPESVISIALREISAAVASDFTFLYVRTGDHMELKGLHAHLPDEQLQLPKIHHLGECLCGMAATEGTPIYSPDVACDSRCTRSECKNAGIHSFAAVPLHGKDGILGTLGLASRGQADFQRQAIFLETLSSQVAVSLQNAIAYRQFQNTVTELNHKMAALKVAEDQHDLLTMQLWQTQKMESVGLLAGGIAHDFNNILSAIIGYGNLMVMKLKPNDTAHAYAEQILNAAHRAARLTQGLLTFSRKEPPELRTYDLNTIIASVKTLLKGLLRENIDLRVHLTNRDLPVLADAGKIEQVLMNLATNAADAMPEGGHLVISSEPATLSQEFVELHGCGEPGQYAVLTITDSGKGMDSDTLLRAFDPFFTTKGPGKGTGLGLSISYGIIRQHSGFILVDSSPGSGTSFRIHLPLTEMTPPYAKTAAPIAPRHQSGTGETVLVAEDDDILRRLLVTVLREAGYTVIEAVNGEDALKKYSSSPDAIRITVLDMIMPKKNGRDVFLEIRRANPAAKILLMSGYTPEIVRNGESELADADVMAKPVSPVELLAKIRHMLNA